MRWISSWVVGCVVMCALQVNAQEWESLTFLAPSSSLKSVCVTNQYIYAAGVLGTVVRSDDFGISWTLLPSENVIWRRVRFSSDSIGWLCGDDGHVARTSNAGETWTNHLVEDVNVRDIWSPDGVRAIAVGSYGQVGITADSGESWVIVHTGEEGWYDDLLAVDFVDTLIGCAVGGYSATRAPRILLTHDGGANWTVIETDFIGWLASVKYVTDSVLVAAGKYGQILRSTDGGLTWDSVFAVSGSTFAIREVDFADTYNGFAVSDNGTIYASTDGGLTWTLREDSLESLQGIDLTSQGCGVAVGSYGVSLTEDAGQTWSNQQAIPGGEVLDIDFFDSMRGWVLTQSNYVLRTADGGVTWQTSQVNSTGAAVMLAAVSENVVVILSSASELLHSSDGGASWSQVYSDNSAAITDVSFANEDTGYACGQLGAILATIDGGETWTQEDSLAFSLNAIYAVDGSHVWAVGNSGIVARKYGEEAWAVHTQFPQSYDFIGVDFADALSGAIIDATGTSISTRDGGASWFYA